MGGLNWPMRLAQLEMFREKLASTVPLKRFDESDCSGANLPLGLR
jgi:hypothetical protein